jgi:hypothetical protein
VCGDLLHSGFQLRAQHLEGRFIGPRSGAYNEIDSQYRDERKDITPHDFPKSPLQAIALHNGTPMLWNNDANPRMTQKGSEDPNLEMLGSSSLPFTQDPLQIRPPGQAKLPGIGSLLRRRRTWLAAGR